MSNHVSLLPKIINSCPCAHGIKSEILTLASSPLNSFVPDTLPDLLSSNCIWHPVSFLCLFPSNGQLIWSFHRWNVVFFFLSLSHCLILTSVSLNAICSETFFLVSYVWSSSCIVQYTPWHAVFLPSIYHSCNKVVMWLDSQCPQHYVCKLYEGNFSDQNRHEMKRKFFLFSKREPSVVWSRL